MTMYTSGIASQLSPRPVASTLSPHRIQISGGRPRSGGRLLALASIFGSCGGFSRRSQRKARVSLASLGRTELLVDGDCHSIDGIRLAIGCLEEHCGQKVHTTLFAEPQRCQNKKWGNFIRAGGISFQPIQRSSQRQSAEPNDKAITKMMRRLSLKATAPIAILTEDGDFINPVLELQAAGTNIMVLIPENLYALIRRCETQGVHVLKVPLLLRSASGTRVRASLHQDGNGSVELADPHVFMSDDTYLPAKERVEENLESLGYGEGGLAQKCAKFWYENQLGTLTIFPEQLPVMAVNDVFRESNSVMRRTWKPYSGNVAHFLPITSRGRKLSKKEKNIYGYVRARGIFKGGGPFILEDSSDLVVNALKRLGFLDDGLNPDVVEAMFLFINLTENKKLLRKGGFLPLPEENYLDVDRKLGSAFLSHVIPAGWQIMREQAMDPVLSILKRAKVLTGGLDSAYSNEELFQAMKLYAKQQQLPVMRNFNGLAWRILRHNDRSPKTRSLVDFNRWSAWRLLLPDASD